MGTIIEATGVMKRVRSGAGRPTQEILRGVDFAASPGEFVSILGPSGSGKSTLLRCLSGLTPLSDGHVFIQGSDISQLTATRLAVLRRTVISYIFQSYNLLPALSAFDNIVLPLRLAHRHIDAAAVQRLMNDLRFEASLTQLPAALSGGEQQKVAIARALVERAQVVFADEPTGALDTVSRQIIFTRLQALAQAGACVVMVTHDIAQAAQTDRALLLRDGQIVCAFRHPSEGALFAAMRGSEEVHV
ncbi:ABC transporter ATP-binding protein [Lacticaseibacillus absianus]|uniref:ABC transporter ATP-binding protein n=1 Tax=Lacticaseibacillus absianus TaxID=2729623 RepID=UPI0015CCEA60|nr:ABC transporter ATP-binding protein [Lacticaseibacillus absianus]